MKKILLIIIAILMIFVIISGCGNSEPDDGGETLLFLGSDNDLNYDEESGHYWDNFRNVWPIINDQTCSMIPVDWNEEYINYTVPIKLNGQETNLRMVMIATQSGYKMKLILSQ